MDGTNDHSDGNLGPLAGDGTISLGLWDMDPDTSTVRWLVRNMMICVVLLSYMPPSAVFLTAPIDVVAISENSSITVQSVKLVSMEVVSIVGRYGHYPSPRSILHGTRVLSYASVQGFERTLEKKENASRLLATAGRFSSQNRSEGEDERTNKEE